MKEVIFGRIVMKKCPYYYLIDPIMIDQQGTNPILVAKVGLLEEEEQSN